MNDYDDKGPARFKGPLRVLCVLAVGVAGGFAIRPLLASDDEPTAREPAVALDSASTVAVHAATPGMPTTDPASTAEAAATTDPAPTTAPAPTTETTATTGPETTSEARSDAIDTTVPIAAARATESTAVDDAQRRSRCPSRRPNRCRRSPTTRFRTAPPSPSS